MSEILSSGARKIPDLGMGLGGWNRFVRIGMQSHIPALSLVFRRCSSLGDEIPGALEDFEYVWDQYLTDMAACARLGTSAP